MRDGSGGGGAVKKRSSRRAPVLWADRDLRFLASVNFEEKGTVLLRLDLRCPTAAQAGVVGVDTAVAEAEDDFYLDVGALLQLRPYEPRHSMLALVASQHEVVVRVETFWSGQESGGNSGRAVRRGTVFVSGETAALRSLRGEQDVPRTRLSAAERNRDASGVRGVAHSLVGGITLRRVHRAEAASGAALAARWVCVDYTSTHARYCQAVPRCHGRPAFGKSHDSRSTSTSSHRNGSACLEREGLTLLCDSHNEHDANAIQVMAPALRGGVPEMVGFVPRALAACLSPALRGGLVRVSGAGVHSAPIVPRVPPGGVPAAAPRFRVWFQVVPALGAASGAALSAHGSEIMQTLELVPWWVGSDVRGA
jgi:hypothetical protein